MPVFGAAVDRHGRTGAALRADIDLGGRDEEVALRDREQALRANAARQCLQEARRDARTLVRGVNLVEPMFVPGRLFDETSVAAVTGGGPE